MEHPGVKSLLDRILKQQPGHGAAFTKNKTEHDVDNNNKKNEQIDLDSNHKDDENVFLKPTTGHATFNRLSDFKESLKQRMKMRRMQIRKEEEYEEKLDEEYQILDENEKGFFILFY
jgi:hypothetical protein